MTKSETIEYFKNLATKYGFTLIPARGKSPFESGWQRWCIEKRQFNERDYIDYDGTLLNAAVTCGPANGILVLDIDDRLKFKECCEKYALDVPDTFTVITGSGGRHLYYSYPDDGYGYGNSSKTKDYDGGFDVRGVGGVVIAPGSTHSETGNRYKIEKDIAMVPAPDWLKDRVRKNRKNLKLGDTNKFDEASPVGMIAGLSFDVDLNTLKISNTKKKLIKNGVPIGERSETIWHLLIYLIENGFSNSVIFGIFEKYAIGEKYREKGDCRHEWLLNQIEKIKDKIIKDFRDTNKSKSDFEAEKILDLLKRKNVKLIQSGTLFYIRFDLDNKHITLELDGREFKDRLIGMYHAENDAMVSDYAIGKVKQILRAKALAENSLDDVHVRIAGKDNKIYIDLADADWRVVEIDCNGWRILDRSPVPFIRTGNMLTLPDPDPNAQIQDINELRTLINCTDDHIWTMIVGWIINCFQTDGPYFILSVHGAPGSAKSTLVRLLHSLLDPSTTILKAFQRNIRSLMISASKSRILSFDNLSSLSVDDSDALCRISTDGSFSEKTLYTDADEYVIKACRPIIINGVNNCAAQADLADRIIDVELKRINDKDVVTDDDILNRFNMMHPKLLGALFSIISVTLKNYETVTTPFLPRMAKAAKWITAAESGLGWNHCHFINEYRTNQIRLSMDSFDDNPLVQPIFDLLDRHPDASWAGTPSELYGQLTRNMADRIPLDWPKSTEAMSRKLNTMIPMLQKIGLQIENSRTSKGRIISLSKSK